MAVELEVTFRGMFHLALPPPGGKRARILMPRNDVPRVARGNERYTIPPYVSYVAIPYADGLFPRPDLVCDLPVGHSETFDGTLANASSELRIEAMSRAKRRDRVLPEPRKEKYAIYYANGYEVVVDALHAQSDQLQFDRTAVADTQRVRPGARSVYWLTPMRADPVVQASLADGQPPAAAACYVKLNNGSMQPRGLLPHHRFRYLNRPGDLLSRAVAQELLVTVMAEELTKITLRALEGDEIIAIEFTPNAGDRVIVGCEPIDDILGISSVQSCVEPVYDAELLYDFVGGVPEPIPVPLCSDNSDHRSPPGALCGPPTGGP